jgi:hypothetical protein
VTRVPDDDLTFAVAGTATDPPAPSGARFAPGSIVAGRYRLVALLGRGGMGEVYRADDLTLDQPVALKFLPEGVGADPQKLAQFHNELRTARLVSHKNVVRLYDLGEADGRRFLTMEYVDGEDLASLLRRIGRIPQDKAIELARQLCAGVAAAHERGVLHRDLKPANVMVDGEGNLRITDFGIAAPAASAASGMEPTSGFVPMMGTPQYMAPEQLAGEPATVRTDLYALGLVLFEIFTGRRAYDAKTLSELRQQHDTGTVTTPSSVVRDLDPAVERVILRCLDKDPQRRPASALGVAASLPGGDPLAAALAAGETPSPAMLLAAGEAEALPVATGLGVLVWVVAGVLTIAALSARTSIVGRTPWEKSPAVLIDRAEEIVASLGYTDAPVDRGYNVAIPGDYLAWIRETDRSPRRWDVLSSGNPTAVILWYRSSPREMVPLVPYSVRPNDPPANDSGMRTVILDTRGRLQEFHAVPPQFDPTTAPAPVPGWDPLFAAAGLRMSDFTSAASQWTPRDFADTRAAWEGTLPGTSHHIRIEAASYQGRPVAFAIVGPWARPNRQLARQQSSIDSLLNATLIVGMVLLLVGAVAIARYNFRLNRADRRGAARVASVVVAAYGCSWLLAAHHVSEISLEFSNLLRSFNIVVANGLVLWVVYIALEPYVRRFWPDLLLGWTRLVSGRVRDPRVGRDVLAGVGFGVALAFTELGQALLVPLLGLPAPQPSYGARPSALLGPGSLLGAWSVSVGSAVISALITVLLLVVLRLLVRRLWLVNTLAAAVLALTQLQNLNGILPALVFPIAGGALLTFVTLRFGLLTLAVTTFVALVLTEIPLTLRLSHWSAPASTSSIAVVIALAAFAFYAARAGQPLLGDFADKVKS